MECRSSESLILPPQDLVRYNLEDTPAALHLPERWHLWWWGGHASIPSRLDGPHSFWSQLPTHLLSVEIFKWVNQRKTNIIWHHLYAESQIKKKIQMNLFTQQKQTHRLREWTSEHQERKAGERDRSGSLGWTCMGVCVLSHFIRVWLFAILWTVAHQAPLSMAFSRQEYWSELQGSPSGDPLNLGIEVASPSSSALQAGSLLLSHRGNPWHLHCGI